MPEGNGTPKTGKGSGASGKRKGGRKGTEEDAKDSDEENALDVENDPAAEEGTMDRDEGDAFDVQNDLAGKEVASAVARKRKGVVREDNMDMMGDEGKPMAATVTVPRKTQRSGAPKTTGESKEEDLFVFGSWYNTNSNQEKFCTFTEALERAKQAMIIKDVSDNEVLALCDKVMIVACATGYFVPITAILKDIAQDDNWSFPPDNLANLVETIWNPSLNGTTGSSKASMEDAWEGPAESHPTRNELFPSGLWVDQFGPEMHSTAFTLSANCQVLFHSQGITNNSQTNHVMLDLAYSTPNVNFRKLKIRRVWRSGIEDMEGESMIERLWSCPLDSQVMSMINGNFVFWPYAIGVKSGEAEALTSMFCHIDDPMKSDQDERVLPEHASKGHAELFLKLMSSKDVDVTIDTSDPLLLIQKGCGILVEEFGNLQTPCHWKKLLNHLCSRAMWLSSPTCLFGEEEQVDTLPTPRLVHITVMLFQALCPIRFAYLDGQCRIISTAHFIRQLAPVAVGPFTELKNLSTEVGARKMSGGWSLKKTGNPVLCHAVVPKLELGDCIPSKETLLKLSQVSVMGWRDIELIESHNFTDAIANAIRQCSFSAEPLSAEKLFNLVLERQKFVFWQLMDGDKNLYDKVFARLSKPGKSPKKGQKIALVPTVKEIQTKAFGIIFEKNQTKCLPYMKDRYLNNKIPEMCVLTRVLGVLLANESVALLLLDCMNKEWKVDYGSGNMLARGYEKKDFALGTFYNNESHVPLIPIQIDRGWDCHHHILISFFTSVYFLSLAYAEYQIALQGKKRQSDYFVKEHAVTVAFVTIAKQVLHLHRDNGIPIPVLKKMSKVMNGVYSLISKEKDEGTRYGSIFFDQVTLNQARKEAWSNVPIIIWLIALLVKDGVLEVENRSQYLQKKDPKPIMDLDDVGVCVTGIIGKGPMLLRDFVDFLLFELVEDATETYTDLRVKLNTAASKYNKNDFYENLENMYVMNEMVFGDNNRELLAAAKATEREQRGTRSRKKGGRVVQGEAVVQVEAKAHQEGPEEAKKSDMSLKSAKSKVAVAGLREAQDEPSKLRQNSKEALGKTTKKKKKGDDEEEEEENEENKDDDKEELEDKLPEDDDDKDKTEHANDKEGKKPAKRKMSQKHDGAQDQQKKKRRATPNIADENVPIPLEFHMRGLPSFIKYHLPFWSLAEFLSPPSYANFPIGKLTVTDVKARLSLSLMKLCFYSSVLSCADCVPAQLKDVEVDDNMTWLECLIAYPSKKRATKEWQNYWKAFSQVSSGLDFVFKLPTPLLNDEEKSFLDVIQGQFPITDSNVEASGDDTDTGSLNCWTELCDVEQVTKIAVCNLLHNLKCKVVFDCMLLSSATAGARTLVPRATGTSFLEESSQEFAFDPWIKEFNLLVFNLHVVDLKKLSAPSHSKKRFFAFVVERLFTMIGLFRMEENCLEAKVQKPVVPPSISARPLCCGLVLDESIIAELKELFFCQSSGCLRSDLRFSIDFGKPNGFILFQNYNRRDMRYILPILFSEKEHSLYNEILLFLERNKLYNPSSEEVRNVSLILGGTCTQPLHFDIPQPAEMTDEEFHHVMSQDPCCPASIVLGMGGKNNPSRIAASKKWKNMPTSIQDWSAMSNNIRVVREKEHWFELEADYGFMFTGEFCHAGLPCTRKNGIENSTMAKLERVLLSEYEDKKRSFYHLCGIDSLYEICRFHCIITQKNSKLGFVYDTVDTVDGDNPEF